MVQLVELEVQFEQGEVQESHVGMGLASLRKVVGVHWLQVQVELSWPKVGWQLVQ